jgi:hypothetical protein
MLGLGLLMMTYLIVQVAAGIDDRGSGRWGPPSKAKMFLSRMIPSVSAISRPAILTGVLQASPSQSPTAPPTGFVIGSALGMFTGD